jgi:ubiquinone/menaquinone biosynthesis C-methylase UbiE
MTGASSDPATLFSTKADIFDRYRWDYAPAAISTILSRSAVNKYSTMADIGAGTGILTSHFLDKVRIIYAVEPNQAMRSVAEERHINSPTFRSISRRAESTGLSARSLDMVVVGQALHWFDPDRAPLEFLRILKIDGWLAVIWNKLGESDLSQSLDDIANRYASGKGIRTKSNQLPSYFRGAEYQVLSFGVDRKSNWDRFFGGMTTASWAPDADGPELEGFKYEARSVFDRFKSGEEVTIEIITRVAIGQPNVKHIP